MFMICFRFYVYSRGQGSLLVLMYQDQTLSFVVEFLIMVGF
ncbi:hypothetical protein MNBD_ALPHA11-834 [hydrothermal vent metagenome]|uniref:Uncharacterized protein n=1 Tax=hydrothermal vent metagenome TaxID=652676 RepID=A0A3B0UE63_9ZZZZ